MHVLSACSWAESLLTVTVGPGSGTFTVRTGPGTRTLTLTVWVTVLVTVTVGTGRGCAADPHPASASTTTTAAAFTLSLICSSGLLVGAGHPVLSRLPVRVIKERGTPVGELRHAVYRGVHVAYLPGQAADAPGV